MYYIHYISRSLYLLSLSLPLFLSLCIYIYIYNVYTFIIYIYIYICKCTLKILRFCPGRPDPRGRASKQTAAETSYRVAKYSEGGRHGWKPSSSLNLSIRVFRAYPLIDIRQTVPCRAIRGNSSSANSTLPPPKYPRPPADFEDRRSMARSILVWSVSVRLSTEYLRSGVHKGGFSKGGFSN